MTLAKQRLLFVGGLVLLFTSVAISVYRWMTGDMTFWQIVLEGRWYLAILGGIIVSTSGARGIQATEHAFRLGINSERQRVRYEKGGQT